METVRSADGTTIAFDRSGRGPALILVGGASSTRLAAAANAMAAASMAILFSGRPKTSALTAPTAIATA